MAVQFSYDAQIRRFVLQFIRLLSNFQVEFGQNSAGSKTLQSVPIYYGDQSRQASMILRGNSENTLNAVPAMATYISGLTYDRDRVLNPYFEGKMVVRDQVFNQASQMYTGTQDSTYTVERLMPAPYKLQMKVDIWTSNTDQKHQLIEQILPLFNPALEIQNSDNYMSNTPTDQFRGLAMTPRLTSQVCSLRCRYGSTYRPKSRKWVSLRRSLQVYIARMAG